MLNPDFVDTAIKWLTLFSLVGTPLMAIGALLIKRTMATKEDVAKLAAERVASDEEFEKKLSDMRAETAQAVAAVQLKLGERVTQVEATCTAVQIDIRHLPDQVALADLRDRIAGVEKEVGGNTASIDGLRQVMERLEMPLNLLLEHQIKGSRA
ncbi:MAG: hypothetical protein PW843_24410 [Azospirillaceae bacterium]|nr:hypothetical protein [Azospirillaceae bacterium]